MRAGGTVLGLVTVRDVMHRHGGEVNRFESGPGGTTFRLDLPLADEDRGRESGIGDQESES